MELNVMPNSASQDDAPNAVEDAPLAGGDGEAPMTDDAQEATSDESEATPAEPLSPEALRAELRRARQEAAKYRRLLREAEAALRKAQPSPEEARVREAERKAEAMEALAEYGLSPLLYRFAVDLATSANVKDSVAAFAAALRRTSAPLPKPAPSSPPASLADQIAAAQQRGDISEVMRLKAALAMQRRAEHS